MRLAVTRPEEDAEATAARLRELGHEVILAPLLWLEFTAPPAIDFVPAALVVTSRNAVRALAHWRAVTRWRDIVLFAVGDATAVAAVEAGFGNVRSASGAGRDLARLVAAEMQLWAGPLLYPTAPERKPELERALAASGFDLRPVLAYRMVPADRLPEAFQAALSAGTIDGILFYSERTATVFQAMARKMSPGATFGKTIFYALSPAVADALRPLQPAHIAVADAPDERRMMALIGKAGG